MPKSPEQFYDQHRKDAERVEKAQSTYGKHLEEAREAGDLTKHPELWDQASVEYQIEAKEKIAEAVKAGNYDVVEELIHGLRAHLERAEKMKVTLDSKEKLPGFTDSISATYTRPDKKIETITLFIKKKLKENCSLYKKTKLDVPPDFEDSIREIWENNIDNIQKAIEENGFDEMIIVPGNIPLTELNAKMTKRYKNATGESPNFKSGGSFAGAKSQNVDKSRIVLVHKTQNLKDRLELKNTLNVKGEDVDQKKILTLEDYLVFQRKYFEETKKHLDENGYTWIATKSGARLVLADWDLSDKQVHVFANDLDVQNETLGARPSRSFF